MTAPVPTDADLARWGELAAAATPGPWSVYRYRHGGGRIHASAEGRPELIADLYAEADREFFLAARDAVPRLLALVAAQAEEIAELRDGMFGWRKHCYDAWAERDAAEQRAERAEEAVARVRGVIGEMAAKREYTALLFSWAEELRAALDGEATP